MSALLLALTLVAAPCTPHVALEGDEALVRLTDQALRAQGVVVGGRDACPPLRVDIRRRERDIVLEIDQAGGRRISRTVRDPELLAPLIESWLRADLAEPLLASPAPRSHAGEEDAGPGAPIADAGMAAPPPSSSGEEAFRPARFDLAARFEIGVGEGGRSEVGAAIELALRLSPAEPTVTLRGASSGELEPPGLTPASSRYAELLVGARVPLAAGPFTLFPALGVGIGVDELTRETCDACGLVVRDDASRGVVGLRTEASLAAVANLADSLFLQLALSAGATPFASRDPTIPSWASEHGERASSLALPPPPRYRLRAAAGLAWRGF